VLLKYIYSGSEITLIMTKKYAVLGFPITHSLSPKIHSYCFEQLGIDATYERFELASGLEAFLQDHIDYSGFSLTMPLKDEAFAVANQLTDVAGQTQSVNTLVKNTNGYVGHNTDVPGIQAAVGFTPTVVAVLGSGATARSALAAFPESRRLIYARNTGVAASLAAKFNAELVEVSTAFEAEVLISTLPQGVLPELAAQNTRPKTLLDAVYTNPEIAAEKYVSGLEMLIHQAIYQQRIFAAGHEDQPLNNEPELLDGLMGLLSVAK
jgi:shikimate dehydrogenase